MDLERIKAARERNRLAMEAENREREERKQRETEAAERAEREFPAMMVQMTDLVLRTPGRPLSKGQVARLKEIRLRNQIMATVEALKGGR